MRAENEILDNDASLIDFIKFNYLPYWPLFAVLLVVSMGAALFYVRWATPMYQSTSQILIKDEKKGTDDSRMMQSLNIFTSSKIIEDQIQVLQSPTITKQVVKNLHLYAPVFEQGRLKTWSAYINSPLVIETDKFDSLYGVHQKVFIEKMYFTYDDMTQKVSVNNQTYSLNQWIKFDFGNIRFLPNPRMFYRATGPLYFSLFNPKLICDQVAKSVDVSEVSKLSTVVDLTVTNEVPQRGEDILNETIKSYNNAGISDKNQLVVNTLSFLKERIDYVKKELDSVERSIEYYKSNKGIVDLSQQSATVLKNVGDNNQKVADARVQIAVLDEAEKYVYNKSNAGGGIMPATLGLNDMNLTQMLQKLYDSESEYEKLRTTIGENNPMVLTLKEEINKSRPAILDNIRIQKVSIQASLKNLDLTNTTYSTQLQAVPLKERGLLEITRQEAILNTVYTFLLQKREESALAYASTVPDSRTVNVAESTLDPVSPRKAVILAAAFIIAMVGGIVIVAAKDLLNTKLLFRKDIAKLTRFPVLGEISNIKKKNNIFVVQENENMVLNEELRYIRTALGLNSGDTPKKKLLFTSGMSGEGKSFVSANMAMSLAMTGRKVVLLDFDLRNPAISSFLGINEEIGLVDFFDEEREPYEIIKSTSCKSLFMIGSGKLSTQFPELSFNNKLRALFEYLERVFDFIVVDTSPIESISDAYVLSQYCDATIYVARHNYTQKVLIRLLEENNKLKPLKNLSLVFNGVKSRGLIKGRYGIEYGYGYENFHKQNKTRVSKPIAIS
jgi:tyrosine-protein kinase Etk/Wzc